MAFESGSVAVAVNFLVADKTSSRIRTNAIDLFVKHGYQGVGMRQLAHSVGMKAGSLYNYIGSKEELLFELIYDFEIALSKSIRSAVAFHKHPAAKVSAFVESYLRFCFENKQLHVLANRESAYLESVLDGKVQRLRSERVNLLQTVSENTPNVFSSAQKHRLALAAVLGMLAGVVQETSDSECDDSICFACNAALKILGHS
ncbi:TetR/AcrR family transcriptional regulator [Pseudomonas sp. H11T01]|uniref:TetR/AcrR family transcriptional regulator n=1 Tax=Pseudomonas sp. H11T01 TaxID=3402749 RepID=UPI003AC0816D